MALEHAGAFTGRQAGAIAGADRQAAAAAALGRQASRRRRRLDVQAPGSPL